MLRCSMVAQREAARQRRDASANFAGVFSSEIPLLPVGWLTVTVDSLKHPPVALNRAGPDRNLSVVVHATGSRQHAFVQDADGRGEREITPPDEIPCGVSLSFEVRKQQLQDRSQHVLVEIHGAAGIHGAVSLPLARAMRPGAEFDGVYELMDPEDRASGVRGYRQHGEIAPTSIRLRFYYLASSQKNSRSSQPMLFTRGPVMPYSDRDLGVMRPQSASAQRLLAAADISAQTWGTAGQPDLGQSGRSEYGRNERKQLLPSRPQSAQPEFREREELSVRGPRNRVLPRPQSADPRERHGSPFALTDSARRESRPQSPASIRRTERPQSAAADTRRRPPSIDPIFASKRRLTTSSGRPASAGARRPPPSSVAAAAEGRRLVMMPIARAAELHSQLREPIKEDFTVLEDQSGEHAEAGAIFACWQKQTSAAHEDPRWQIARVS